MHCIFKSIMVICLWQLVLPGMGFADLDDLDELDTDKPVQKPVKAKNRIKADKPANNNEASSPDTSLKATPFARPDLNPELKKNTERSKSRVSEEPAGTQLKPSTETPKTTRIRTTPEEEDSNVKHPVKLKSLGLRAQKDGGIVELQKNVVITQGPLSLKADYSKVFLDPETNEVIKANATGNVRMDKQSSDPSEVIKAKANSAVFLNKERKVVLKGKAQLWRGSSLLKGKKIIYDLATGWITFDSAEGVMQPAANKN